MASSTLTGDKRWASTRKSGMTVLGKVPKPINLPSQRLENHGLDPNVEIVPRGTITWGSRISSSTPNAWAYSGLSSPNTDGSAGSPVNARPSSGGSGPRPSSGGSGPRPSTSGSDMSHELASTAWGPNSRPSSSSGVLASNQTPLVTTRPRSAETRPGSSQLSRFAENLTDNSVAWGPTKIADRLGATSSRNDGFTLSSGDFPTLGSEKNSESRGHSSHGYPSASGRAALQKEAHECPSSDGTADQYDGGGVLPDMDKWQRDTQQTQPYGSVHVLPRQFERWHGPLVHSPDGVWYRGGLAGGPYRPPGPHGSYPVEPFPYCSPQLPASLCSNSQTVPRPEAGPGGYNTKNVESCSPHLPPDSYMVPSHPFIPYRPGVYPGQVLYDGYYGPPPANFHHSVELEVPATEMNAQPAFVNQFNQNASIDSGKFDSRAVSHDPVTKQQKESDRARGNCQGQYKLLLKQHDGQEDNGVQGRRWQCEMRNPSHVERGDMQGASLWDGDREGNGRKDVRTANVKSMPGKKASSQPTSKWKGHTSGLDATELSQTSSMAADDNLTKKPVPSVLVRDLQQYPIVKENATMTVKIEGLNNKAWIADSHSEAGPFLYREKEKNSKAANVKVAQATRAISTNDASDENYPTSNVITSACDLGASLEEKKREASNDQKVASGPQEWQTLEASVSCHQEDGKRAHAESHSKGHVTQSLVDYSAKSRLNNEDDGEWIKESSGGDSLRMAVETTGEDGIGKCFVDPHASQGTAVVQESHHATNVGGGGSYAASSLDLVDHKAERAKLKEIAAHRARQLQEEEEERTREQKAKALAKLEELNRRTSAQSLNQHLNHTVSPSNDVPQEQDSRSGTASGPDASIVEAPGSVLAQDSDTLKQLIESEVKALGDLTDQSSNVTSWPSNSDFQGPNVPHEPSLSLRRQDARTTGDITCKTSSHPHDSGVSKQKQRGYRRRQNISQEKNIGEKPISSENVGSLKTVNDVTVHVLGNDGLPSNEEHSVQQRKKNNRGSRYKNKLDETPPSSRLLSSVLSGEKPEQGPIESNKSQPPSSAAEAFSVPSQISDSVENQSSRDAIIASSDARWSPAKEESHGRVSNRCKPQSHRRSAGNHQAITPVDKFCGSDTVIWVPVKPHYKNLPSEESNEKDTMEPSNNSSGKNGLDIQNNMKTKRAEMERYVPKHVAKELPQQESSQHALSSLNQAGSVNNAGKSDSGSKSPESGRLNSLRVEKSEFCVDTKIGDNNKSNRHGRMHTWCQQNSANSSSTVQSASEDLVSSGLIKTDQEPSDQHSSSKVSNLSKKHDAWNSINENRVQAKPMIPVPVENQGVPSKQKRQQFKAHKFGEGNHAPADNEDVQSGTGDKGGSRSPVLDLNETDVRNSPKAENQNTSSDCAWSHWQPKSQAYSHNHRPGNRGSGVLRIGSQSGRLIKYPAQIIKNHPFQNEDENTLTQQDNFVETRHALHDDTKAERKVLIDQPKEQTSFLNKPNNAELEPPNIDAHHEQSVSSAYHHRRQHNGRFNRGQKASYKVRDPGQDGGKQNIHINGDRQKNSSHYEYQQIGSCNKSSDSFQHNQVGEEAEGGPGPQRSRYRERGHNYSRHGAHFYE